PAVTLHPRTKVPFARRVEHAVVGDGIPGRAGRDARKPSTFLIGGDERLFVDARHTAPRRLCSFAHPSVQRDEQGARDRAVMKRIRELLALSVSDSTSRRYSWTVLHTREEVPANVLRLGEIPGPIFIRIDERGPERPVLGRGDGVNDLGIGRRPLQDAV